MVQAPLIGANLNDVTTWYSGLLLATCGSTGIDHATASSVLFLTPLLVPMRWLLHLRGTAAPGFTNRELSFRLDWDLPNLRYTRKTVGYDSRILRDCAPLFYCTQDSAGTWTLKVHDMGMGEE